MKGFFVDFWGERRWVLGAAALLLVVLVFQLYGVTVWRGGSGRSLFGWLYLMWSAESTDAVDYSHGLVIPFISGWFLWRQRAALRAAWQDAEPHGFGLVLLVGGVLMHAAGLRMQVPHLSALAFLAILWALAWVFGGWAGARLTLFPLAFLGFAIPIGFLAHATFPLRMLGSVVSTWILNGIGIPTVQVRTFVISEAGQGFALDVADACSGIRSIMALMALTAAYAYVFWKHALARWFLFAMSIPIAAVANIGRIVTIAIVARFWGQDLGMRIYHDYSGYLVFILCVFLVMGLSAVMEKAWKIIERLNRFCAKHA